MSQSEKQRKFEQLAAQCDQWIKSGNLTSVAQVMSELNWARVPRADRQSLAKICRRAGLISAGLKLLQPVVREEKENLEPATAGEICEYSVLLSRNGSLQEAQKLLEKVDGTATPEADLYLAFCHIGNWDYEKAIPHLEAFLKSNSDPYSKLIGRVNLGSAYLSTDQLALAEGSLNETIVLAQSSGATRLAGNSLELLGHVHFQKGDFSKAREILDQALKVFENNHSYDPLMISKTQAIMTALETHSKEPLLKFRQQALQSKYWEMVREIDMYLEKIEFDQKKFDHLIFGTPMLSFRKWIQKELQAEPSESYVLGTPRKFELDLQTGEIQSVSLAAGKKIHQTLAALLQDFYKPRSIGTLFSVLYPNEYFDINSSHHRVEQLLWRSRKWLTENKIPAAIEIFDGAYRLQIQNGFGVRMHLHPQTIDSSNSKWLELLKAFPEGSVFSAQEACAKLQWPRSSFLLVIKWALDQGKLKRIGAAKATCYQVLSQVETKGRAA